MIFYTGTTVISRIFASNIFVSDEYKNKHRSGNAAAHFLTVKFLQFPNAGYTPSSCASWLTNSMHVPYCAVQLCLVASNRFGSLFRT
jgi:hypothetical protein